MKKHEELPEVPDDLYQSIGYPDRMTIVHPHQSNNPSGQIDLSKGELIPFAGTPAPSQFYLFAPVHFREREIGYLVLENCDFLTKHQFLFETLKNFWNSHRIAPTENLILEKKTRQLSNLYIH